MDTMYNYKQMVFYNIAFEGNNGWFCHVYYNALCRFDVRTNEILLETMIPCDNTSLQKYGNIFYYEKKLYLSPKNDKRILIYNLETKTFDEVTLDDRYIPGNECINLLSGIVEYKGWLYFFPGRYQAIVKLNILTQQVLYINGWIEELKSTIIDERKVLFASLCRIDSEILLPFWQGNKIMKFDMDDCSYKVIGVGESDNHYAAITFDGKFYWLAPKNKIAVYKWDGENEIQIINNFPINFETRYGIRHLEKTAEGILVFPLCGNMIMEIKNNGTVKKVFSLKMKPEKPVLDFQLADNNFLDYSVYNNLLYTYSIFDGFIYCINLKTKELMQFKALLTSNYILEVREELKRKSFEQNERAIKETPTCALDLLLEYVESPRFNHKEIVIESKNGERIYSKLLKKSPNKLCSDNGKNKRTNN